MDAVNQYIFQVIDAIKNQDGKKFAKLLQIFGDDTPTARLELDLRKVIFFKNEWRSQASSMNWELEQFRGFLRKFIPIGVAFRFAISTDFVQEKLKRIMEK